MKSDDPLDRLDPFDRELRRTLDAMAGEPAPERLLARVAEIPHEEPVMQGFRSRFRLSTPHVGLGSIALAGALVIALAALVLRPVGQAPGDPGSSSIATLPSASALSTGTPSPGAPSSAVQSPSAPAVSPSSASPSSASAPVGFEPVSVTFVSADEGWVLGSVPCGSTRCAAIERTGDGGRTWASAPAPKTAVVSGIGTDTGATSGIARLRFATPSDGWAFGPDLWATHDGGASWSKVSVPGLPSGSTMVALETAHGSVHAAFYDGAQHFRIVDEPDRTRRLDRFSAPGRGRRRAGAHDPAGPLRRHRLAARERPYRRGRSATGGRHVADLEARLRRRHGSGRDRRVEPDRSRRLVRCGPHELAAGQPPVRLARRRRTFAETGSRVPVTLGGGVATPDTSTIVVAGSDAKGSVLVGSFDGGHTWSLVLRAGNVGLTDLGFTTPTQGVVVTSSASGSDRLLMTRDGGHTWSAIEF